MASRPSSGPTPCSTTAQADTRRRWPRRSDAAPTQEISQRSRSGAPSNSSKQPCAAGGGTSRAKRTTACRRWPVPRGTDWALGVEARSHALLSEGETAQELYLEAIERLGRTRVRAGPRTRAPGLRGVAATGAPPRRRPRAAPHCPTTCSRRWAWRRSPTARRPRTAGHRRDRPQAHRGRADRTTDRTGDARWPGWPGTGCQIPRLAVDCSSAPAPSSTTCATSSPSSASARAANSIEALSESGSAR